MREVVGRVPTASLIKTVFVLGFGVEPPLASKVTVALASTGFVYLFYEMLMTIQRWADMNYPIYSISSKSFSAL